MIGCNDPTGDDSTGDATLLEGTWVSSDSLGSYMAFTKNKMISAEAVIYNKKETLAYRFEVAYIVQLDDANPKKAIIKIYDEENKEYYDYFSYIILADNNNSFEAFFEEEGYETTTEIYTRYKGELPTNTTTDLKASDLYGSWEGTETRKYGGADGGNQIVTVCEVTYTFTENSYTTLSKVIESNSTNYPEGDTDTETYTTTQYEVDGSHIIVYYDYNTQNRDDGFLFLNETNKTVIYKDYNIYTKQ